MYRNYDDDLEEYRLAPTGEGKHAGEWHDKPYRILYDLVKMIQDLRDKEKQ